MHVSTPLVSFGLPVRNGAPTLGEAIESLQAQTVADWELVVSDNLSTDATAEVCASYAARDERIRCVPTGRDLSQNENFCAAFRHARGTFFRWYGDDDWLEPEYLERTLGAFDRAPEAVLCTTVQQYYRDGAPVPINDPVTSLGGVVSPDGGERVRELLHLFEHGGHLGVDPVYSLARRDVAATTSLISPIREGDFTFSCEMALRGPFTHVPEVLAHRRLAGPSRSAIPPQGTRGQRLWSPYVQRELSILHLTRVSGSLAARSRLRLVAALLGFAAREHGDGFARRARRLAGRA